MNEAASGEVLQLAAERCPLEATVTNTAAFTVQGASSGGGTVLEPTAAAKTLVESSADVQFTLTDLTFAKTEEAPAVLLSGPGEAVTLSDDTFSEDSYPGGFGAGVSIQLTAPSTATGPTRLIGDAFRDDHAASGGGAALLGSAPWLVERSTFAGDSSSFDGGGLFVAGSEAGSGESAQAATLTGSDDLFSANSAGAGGRGGAIYVGGPSSSCTGTCPGNGVTLDDSTVVANAVEAGAGSEGGAIWGAPDALLAVNNSIVYGNAPQPEIVGFATTSPTFAFSDVCTEQGGPAVSGAGDICGDPKLQASGAETVASPTIDAGSNALVPAGLSTDIAGNARIIASRHGCQGLLPATVDMGAFEFTVPLGVALSCPAEVNCAAAASAGGSTPPECLVACADAAGARSAEAAQPSCPPFERVLAPTIRIGAGRLRDRHGEVAVQLSCAYFEVSCHGSVTLRTAHAVSSGRALSARHRGRRGQLVLGSAGFGMSTGHTETVELHLTARAVLLFARHRTLAVAIRARARESKPGFQATATRVTTLSRAARHR